LRNSWNVRARPNGRKKSRHGSKTTHSTTYRREWPSQSLNSGIGRSVSLQRAVHHQHRRQQCVAPSSDCPSALCGLIWQRRGSTNVFLVPSSRSSFCALLHNRLLRTVPGQTVYERKVSFPDPCRSRSRFCVRATLPYWSILTLLQNIRRLLLHGVWILPHVIWHPSCRYEDSGHQRSFDQTVSHLSPADKPVVHPGRKQSPRSNAHGIISTAYILFVCLQPLVPAHSFLFPDLYAESSSWQSAANRRSAEPPETESQPSSSSLSLVASCVHSDDPSRPFQWRAGEGSVASRRRFR